MFRQERCGKNLPKKQRTISQFFCTTSPEYIAEDAKKTDIDLIVCGHTHGGQIQLPFISGVIAPNQGLFPKYDKGEFDLDGTKMIVCAGLSNTVFIPRINNQVEIGVVTVV